MVHELFDIGIAGAGPAGCACAYFINRFNPGMKIALFDYSDFLRTILPTGGGKCNLSYAEFDNKELAKNYPRGEKFLYSVFSRFSVQDTLDFFNDLGVETYIREDGRIFPVSNNSAEVRQKLLRAIHGVRFIKERVLRIDKTGSKFKILTDKNKYSVGKVVYSTGSRSGFEIIKRLGVSVVDIKPSLCGFRVVEDYTPLMGTSVKNVYNYETGLSGSIIFTHYGISGPLIYKISSLKSRDTFPFMLTFDLNMNLSELREHINSNPNKCIKNVLSIYIPAKLAKRILVDNNISADTRCKNINKEQRELIKNGIVNFRLHVKSPQTGSETVNSGGVISDEITPRTMESKVVPGLYFCGEVINIDGFCGGFNLQNCWSTAYSAALAIAG